LGERLAGCEKVMGSNPFTSTMKFYHGPAVGDLIYGLPVMKTMGGGELYMDPLWTHHEKFMSLRSFLERQPYINEVHMYGHPNYIEDKFFVNLDCFKEVEPATTTHLVRAHYLGLNMTPPVEIEPWLVARTAERRYPVVIHRSPRYRDPDVSYTFLKEINPKSIFCVGYGYEVDDLLKTVNATWLETPTVDAMATIINSCDVFIGNQSSPYALATGLGKCRMLERHGGHGWDNVWLGQKNERQAGRDAKINLKSFFELHRMAKSE
jgi:hypothetical protein